jgi:hypothetical protein
MASNEPRALRGGRLAGAPSQSRGPIPIPATTWPARPPQAIELTRFSIDAGAGIGLATPQLL